MVRVRVGVRVRVRVRVRVGMHLAEPQVRPASQPVLLPRTVTQPKLAYTNIFRNSIQNKVAGERVHFSKF